MDFQDPTLALPGLNYSSGIVVAVKSLMTKVWQIIVQVKNSYIV